MDAGTTISRRRSLIKYKARAALPSLYTPRKDFIFLPPAEYFFLKLRQIELATHWSEHNPKTPTI